MYVFDKARDIYDFKNQYFDVLSIQDYPKSISVDDARLKWQTRNLYSYLDELSCRSILVEKEYVDHDFLDDYASYYAKCFDEYRRFCRRAHFFSLDMDKIDYDMVFLKHDEEAVKEVRDAYLGFMVVKPLPNTIIGRTIVKVRNDTDGRSKYKAVRPYDINLFGLELTIEGLAFQEQDSVLAACATTALWSAFHMTSHIFHTPISTPSEITKSATKYVLTARALPSDGLIVEQICNAISLNGLVPEVQPVNPDTCINSLLYAYVSSGIPAIIGYEIVDTGALHAVTVCGYRIEDAVCNGAEVVNSEVNLNLIGKWISEFYVQDDNIGPYSRLLSQDRVSPDNDAGTKGHDAGEAEEPINPRLFSRSREDIPEFGQVCEPRVLVIPVYHKIRLKFNDILGSIRSIDKYLLAATGCSLTEPPEGWFTWDIRLVDLYDFKRKVVELHSLLPDDRHKLLFSNLPKYIWVASARLSKKRIFSLIADATDIKQSFYFKYFIPHEEGVKEHIAGLIHESDPDLNKAANMGLGTEFAAFIKNEIIR